MARFAKNPQTGETIVYDAEMGDWRPASEAEVRLAGGGLAAKAEAAAEGATGAMAIGGMLGLPGAAERSQALQGAYPGISKAAEIAGLVGAGASVGAGIMSRMAGRVATKATQGAAREAGESALKTSQGFIKQPEMLLPEALQGAGRIVRAGAESTPVTRIITDALIRNPNQRNINRLVGRSMLLTDDEIAKSGGKLTDELLGLSSERIGQKFREVEDLIQPNLNHDDVVKTALDLNEKNLIDNLTLKEVKQSADKSAMWLMDMRSQLLKASRKAQTIAEENQIKNSIDEIDKIIEKAVDEPVAQKLYSDARAYYKNSLALKKGQAIGKTGDVNAATLDNNLRSVWGDKYREGADFSNLPTEIQDSLQAAREVQGVNVGLPTSGTSERTIGQGIIGGVAGGLGWELSR